MNLLLKSRIGVILLMTAPVIFSGCATRGMYQQANNDFAKGFDAANGTLAAILSSTTRDMRLQAIGYYIENGSNDKEFNLDPDDIENSFARYVCAGFGSYAADYGNLNTLDAYKSHIAALSKAPGEDISQLIGSIKHLDKPQPVLSLPEGETPVELQDQCRTNVLKNVPPGNTLERPSTEGLTEAFVAIDQIEALVNSLQTAAISILQVVDDAKRTKALKQYVSDNNETIQSVMDNLAKSESILVAWKIRKNAALVVPYFRFEHMLKNIDRQKEIEKLLKQEAAVNESLTAYDQIGVILPPERIIAKMVAAQSNLVRLAEGNLKPGEAWAAFLNFRDSVSAVNDAIGTATSAVEDFDL